MTKTKDLTIVALISELIETHMEKCDGDQMPNGDAIPHVISGAWGTKANITLISNCDETIRLVLDDGSEFVLHVETVHG